jgi:hypothetical protein
MSKIQEALNKLQVSERRNGNRDSSVKHRPLPKTVIPTAKKKHELEACWRHWIGLCPFRMSFAG